MVRTGKIKDIAGVKRELRGKRYIIISKDGDEPVVGIIEGMDGQYTLHSYFLDPDNQTNLEIFQNVDTDWMNNKTLRKTSERYFYVIIAKRDGGDKYVSRKYPDLFPYTVKLSESMRFLSKDKAQSFVEKHQDIELIEIRKVRFLLELL